MKKIILLLSILFLSMFDTGYAQSSTNYVASFNGIDSYARIGTGNTAATYTLEAWVNPSSLGPTTKAIFGKDYQTGFFLGIQSTGRIIFYPKNSLAFRSRVTGIVPVGQWTHVAATYNGSLTCIYINGVLDTSTTAITGATTMNDDTLYIGADRVSTENYFFHGYMDNVRIWKTARTAAQIKDNKSIPYNFFAFGLSGIYSSIDESIQFNQDINNYTGRNLTLVNYSNKAVNITDYNNNLLLNGITDYCTHENGNHWFDLQESFTIEAWIKRDTTGAQPLYQNIVNKSGGTNGLDYGIYLTDNGDLYFAINKFAFILQALAAVSTAQWTHVAASYIPSIGKATIYCNGDSVSGTTFSGNPLVQNNTYEFYVGGTGASNNSANKFKGQLDDIRVWFRGARTSKQIKENMFANKITSISGQDSVAHFTFDRFSNGIHVGGSSHIGGLKYFGNAQINSSLAFNAYSSSPVISDPLGQLNTSAFTMSKKKFFVPDNNPVGITDSIYISDGAPVNNLRVCVMMSHSYTRDVDVLLIAPSGNSAYLLEKNGGNGNDVMTIFSDAADSTPSLGTTPNGPGINAPFSPGIKGVQPLSMLNGLSRKGWWKLKITDYAGPDVGYVHGWGLNMSSQRSFKLSAFIQGFYNNNTKKMIKDTAKVFLRSTVAPYVLVDSAKSVLDSNGKGNFYFNRAVNSTSYYVVLAHRNSIDTWSSVPLTFTADTLNYDFTSAASKAYGNNQITIDSSPLRFAIYSGDVYRDGSVNIRDIIEVHNDATNFVTGYKKTDVNGDGTVNISDILLVQNNTTNFVALRRP